MKCVPGFSLRQDACIDTVVISGGIQPARRRVRQ